MEKYEKILVKNGFDMIEFIGEDIINEQDLEDIGVQDAKDRNIILTALKKIGFCQGTTTNCRAGSLLPILLRC
jgi:thiazole synthase ThiGH ThiG subunit